MTLKLEIFKRPSSVPYDIFFKSCSHALIQQSVLWSDVISPLSPDTPYFLIVKDQDENVLGGIPVYYFKTDLGAILTSVPHAGPLGGILCKKNCDEILKNQIYSELMQGAIGLAKELNCISLTIITNPFLSDAEFYSQPVHPDYIFNNFCQIIDLHNLFPENDSYYSEKSGYTIDRNVRRNLKKALENKVSVEWATEADFEEWYSIHVKRHTELGAEPLPRALLINILDILSKFNMAGLVVAKLNNRIAGGCIFVWNKEVADAYILSSDSDYTEYGINHAITDFAVRYFHEKGFRWFNWQGCKRDSGVYRFKQSWGGMEKSYQFLTWTFDGFQNIFSYNFEDIPREYKWHYVAPFEAIKNKAQKGIFNK